MNLNFSDNSYFKKAKEIINREEISDNILENEDAFFLLIHGVSKEDLSNLCNLISNKYNVMSDEAYRFTQEGDNAKRRLEIFSLSLELILSGKKIGEDNNHNSDWISHCVYEALLCYEFASMLDLNTKYAFNYGLMHDYGRKYIHDFSHVIEGFESLIDLGLYDEAKGCLTHSFINGGRYCCMQPAPEGFLIDKNNEIHCKETDEMYEVLSKSKYTIYDEILNIADLMATSKGIVSPKERVEDILTRRDNLESSPNWGYFLTSFYNLLLDTLRKLDIEISETHINCNDHSIEEIKMKFIKISEVFFKAYKIRKANDKIEYNIEEKSFIK